jgi:hypothetical protein
MQTLFSVFFEKATMAENSVQISLTSPVSEKVIPTKSLSEKLKVSLGELRQACVSEGIRVGAGINHLDINRVVEIEDLAMDMGRHQDDQERFARLENELQRLLEVFPQGDRAKLASHADRVRQRAHVYMIWL